MGGLGQGEETQRQAQAGIGAEGEGVGGSAPPACLNNSSEAMLGVQHNQSGLLRAPPQPGQPAGADTRHVEVTGWHVVAGRPPLLHRVLSGGR